MNVLRHWIVCDSAGRNPRVVSDAAEIAKYQSGPGWQVSGPYVLEATTRGAVDLLRELYAAGLDLADLIGSDDAFRRWELAMDAARPLVGGQSAPSPSSDLPKETR